MLPAIIDYYEMVANIPLKTGKVAVYSLVAENLSKYSTRPNPWSWRYVHGLVSGRLPISKYMQQAIEKLHNEINGKPDVMAVPACPVCASPTVHIHAHNEIAVNLKTHIPRPRKTMIDPRRRPAINTDDMASAARTIQKHITPEQIRELIYYLNEAHP